MREISPRAKSVIPPTGTPPTSGERVGELVQDQCTEEGDAGEEGRGPGHDRRPFRMVRPELQERDSTIMRAIRKKL